MPARRLGESRSLLVAKEVLKEREDALALFSPRMPKMKKTKRKKYLAGPSVMHMHTYSRLYFSLKLLEEGAYFPGNFRQLKPPLTP